MIADLFGLHTERLETYQMIARGIVIFFTAIVLVRISGVRTFGKQNTFDHLTALILGAIMGRAVVAASQPFFGSILAALVVMLLHRAVAWITFKSKRAGLFFKGEHILLIRKGKKQQRNLEKTNITDEDIMEALRQQANSNSLDEIEEVYLERSGKISFVKKE